ncbi:MAG: hypothetical protein M1834_005616 [Cirrosporium novae-zelandiae]|nr:MAG: hypothetical protein M1834_005616 [Cirrosporium novae-zelandiae]
MATMTETCEVESTLSTFTSIRVLDFSLVESPATKPIFLSELREALVIVGFFYLKNTPISAEVRKAFVQKSMDLCNLPLEKKLEIEMIKSKHFLGYSRMGCERTAQKMDHREMFDFLTPLPAPGPDESIYLNVQGPNQWPDEKAVPGFRQALETYLSEISKLGDAMTVLVAEALDLEPTAMAKFFNDPPRNKVSLLKYPPPPLLSSTNGTNGVNGKITIGGEFQGVGPHKDGGFLTYLLQATSHAGLEAQNKSGAWIPVPPIPDTLVVNVGRSLESMTRGVCTATTHRVNLRPENFVDANGDPLGPRFSYPVFQTLKLDLTHEDLLSLKLPTHIRDLVKDEKVKSDAEAFFAKYHLQSPGMGIFTARLTSHPDVGRRWYPEQLAQALKGQREFKG